MKEKLKFSKEMIIVPHKLTFEQYKIKREFYKKE